MSAPSDSGAGDSPRHLQHHRKLAKDLLDAAKTGDAGALARLRAHAPGREEPQLAHAQLAVAREAGFDSWPKLVKELEVRELQEFREALERGDAKGVRRVLHASPSARRKINDPIGDFGGRPINVAAGHRDVLDVLIEYGADINLRSDWANGPYGVLDGCDEQTARYLIEHRGATLTACAAARFGWLDELCRLIDADPAAVHERGGDGQQPLHQAKTPEVAAFLLDRGAEIDARCIDHQTTAAQYALVDRPDVCRFLLSRGATPDIFMPARLGDAALAEQLIAADPSCLAARIRVAGYAPVHDFSIYCWTLGFFMTPHDVALKFEHRDLYELLLRHSPPKVRMLDAIAHGYREAANAARAAGVELTPQDHRLLAIAIFHDRRDAARLMLELGFDPSVGGIDGGTALHAAAWLGDVELVEAILRTGRADVNLPDPQHRSPPLGWAAYGSVHRRARDGDYVKVVERLVSGGADIKMPGNGRGMSFVKMAEGNVPVQEALRRLGGT